MISPTLAGNGTRPATAAALSWSWQRASANYVFTLIGPALLCDCRAPAGTASQHPAIPAALADSAVLLRRGTQRQAVAWDLEAALSTDAMTHVIRLRATDAPLTATITLAEDPASFMLSRTTVLRHHGAGEAVDITATLGFWLGVHEPIERMFHLTGAWAQETRIRRAPLDAEGLTMESRAGKTGFAFQPYVSLRAAAATYLCEILWSGNWMLRIFPEAGRTVIAGGLNDWKFRHRLVPGGSLTLPTVLFGRFEGGLNHATQRLHDYRRAHRPDRQRAIPVQFNSWYPIFGEPTAETTAALIPAAKRLGCEAFVLDAGWYRTADGDSAEDWQTRTGDWFVSHRRFPAGLRSISTLCREANLRFGLWFEPEVIGPPSEIRRTHPDWLHHIDGIPPPAHERAILHLGVPQARRHVLEQVSRLIARLGVGWMKWDFNADLGPGGWAPGLPERLTAQDPLVAHYQGLYRLQDAIRTRFPDLILEMCASGGGRMDGALLQRAHVNWISDQPGALRKLAIHFGTQLAHPAVACNDWLVEWPPGVIPGYNDQYTENDARGDLAFRLRVAMLGSFGISAPTDRWAEADFAVAARHIALYRDRLRAIIQNGDQYLLTRAPPADGNAEWAAIWYAAKDGAAGALFAFRLQGAEQTRRFPLPGLLASARYAVRGFEGAAEENSGATLSNGLDVTVGERFGSALLLIERL